LFPSFAAALACCLAFGAAQAADPSLTGQPLLFHVEGASQRLEMTVNSSRILTLPEKIPQAQVNNPELLELTPLSATQVQVHAKKAGVTQINLWDEDNEIRTIDVVIFGDAAELNMALRAVFPRASLRVIPLANSAIVTGYVDRPDDVSRVIQISQDYYPNIINSITVGGVQQVLLSVKVMEVSRTKLRALGFDFAQFSGGDSVISTVSGLIASSSNGQVVTSGGETFALGFVDGNNAFFGVLEALRQNDLMKVLAEPKLVTVSGRPAFFNVGGEFPILVPQSLGTVSIEYKKFGTQVDFVPIVLGNGNIRLEVRPRVSEVDNTRSVQINNTTVPGLRVREIDTGAEMRAGQTLALAGLIQTRTEAQTRGLPWISEVPWIGVPFRRVQEQENEVELLIMVTPHLVEAMDPCEVPPCGPGLMTESPNDCELFGRAYIEVPRCGPGPDHYPAGPGPEVLPAGPAYYGPQDGVDPAVEPTPPSPSGSEPTLPAPMSSRAAPPRRTTKRLPSAAESGTATATDQPPARKPAGGTSASQPKPERRAKPAELRVRPATASAHRQPGFIGATGYDMEP
jgi:pilus assembly protein CpaC